jgi:hypothetical protein
LVLLLAPAQASFAYSTRSLILRVYADGYAGATQVLSVDSRATSVQVPLLSGIVSDLVATDQNGSPISYGFGHGNNNITVYTLVASGVTLRYDTNSLTSKNVSIWTLAFTTGYNSTVILPQLATVSSISGTPYSINETNMSPELNLPPGTWKISYGVSLGVLTTTTTGTTGNTGQEGVGCRRD